MRSLLIIALLTIAAGMRAQDGVEVVLADVTDENGKRVLFRTDTKTLAATADWAPGSQDPPLTVTAASKIARESGKRRFPNSDDIELSSITLRSMGCYGPSAGSFGQLVRWYYVVDVVPVPMNSSSAAESTVVILLDGTVVEPTPFK